MKYFHVRNEGESIQCGFNFYPLSGSQFGFIIQTTNHRLICYWSKIVNKLNFNFGKHNLDAERETVRKFHASTKS